MDTTRISIARVLALDVPLTWQDAVAVAQEAAMLSDVHAAMNNQPSLVSPETCFITRTGDLELPVTTEIESPDAVTQLLREMLAGRDAPEALETLAFGHAPRDMSGALQRFPIANRRAEIAKLATRALALQSQPLDAPAPAPAAPAPAPRQPEAPAAIPRPHVAPAPVAPPYAYAAAPPVVPPVASVPELEPLAEPPAAPHVPFIRPAPFRAADMMPPPPAAPPAPLATGVPDAELRRLRRKTVERERTQARLSRRVGAALGRVARVLTWRPASPDPRILGGALIVTAAVVSVVWTGKDNRGAAKMAAPAATAPHTVPPAATPAAPAGGTAPPPASAAVSTPTPSGPTVAAATRPPLTVTPAPSATAGVRGSGARPRTASPSASAPAVAPATGVVGAGASATAAPLAAERPTAAAPRPGVTVTLPAVDAPPGPLTPAVPADPRAPETRASDPRAAETRGGAPAPPALERRSSRGEAVYSASDDDVTPPVLLRQQLPSPLPEPPAEVPEDWPYLELVIDRAGSVEQVRLRAKQPAPGQTLYRHRMLLAAAKAWQFEPARRHGAPVRYVMRVPLEP